MTTQSYLFLILFLICCSAFFSSSETAIFSLNRLRLRRKHEDNPVDSWFIGRLLENPQSLLRVILIGNEVINTSTSVVIAAFCYHLLKDAEPAWLVSVVPVLVATPMLVIFGEIIPKAMAIKMPEAISRFNAPFLTVFAFLVKPIQWTIGQFVNWFLNTFFRIPLELRLAGGEGVDEETFKSMVELGHSEGEVEDSERGFIHCVLELDDIKVRELMTKADKVFALDVNTPVADVISKLKEKRYSRIPVYKNNQNTIAGILYAKDLLRVWRRKDRQTVNGLLRPAYFVPQNQKVSEVLRSFQEFRIHVAVVVDEYGNAIGLVTLQDILDRLFSKSYIEQIVKEDQAEEGAE